ncbi:mannosyl-oligosaccharide glucosidase [Thraustotheca clavata]|uniref:Mannosyl-oligosaccharide glucosidase n=1 Tax=Thraustotheca clavata TaxID=74557 RepID=A0A1V9Z5T7_9STRA|nr:mannosyl-oligosaccharide glucosidase [Thraustotheca clavata]
MMKTWTLLLLPVAAALEQLRWGTYHSGLYFGIRSRTFPEHVSAGLLWTSSNEDVSQIHHECTERDRFETYGWTKHDGKHFGQQSIRDRINRMQLDTTFLKPPLDQNQYSTTSWASRIAVNPLYQEKGLAESNSLFFYFDLGCQDDAPEHSCRNDILKQLQWRIDEPEDCIEPMADGISCLEMQIHASHPTIEIYNFQTRIQAHFRGREASLLYWGDANVNVVNVKEKTLQYAQRTSVNRQDLEIELPNEVDDDATNVIVQLKYDPRRVTDVVLHVVFAEADEEYVTPVVVYDEVISSLEKSFSSQFDKVFPLSKTQLNGKSLSLELIDTAKAAFSSLIGGIGIYLEDHDQIQETSPLPLYSAVPSRSFFPRGFLWDEGFHQLGILSFDAEITMDVIDHWFGTMDTNGYIAREQIRGQLAQKRVPHEFLVQHASHANPPTLLLTIEKLIEHQGDSLAFKKWLKTLMPKLQTWFEWFQSTQEGTIPNTFRWRGRHEDGRLMPNTLASGFDDYPRASTPSDDERHGSDVLSRIADILQVPSEKFKSLRTTYSTTLDQLHWHNNLYLDFGLHSADGTFENMVVIRCAGQNGEGIDATIPVQQLQRGNPDAACPSSHPRFLYPLGDGAGGLLKKQVFKPNTIRKQFVEHVGYVSFLPLFLKLVPVDSDKLPILLSHIQEHLLSPYGLRSLSPSDVYYNRPNAPGDAPYWRGAIWINMNYLALDSFQYYASHASSEQVRKAYRSTYNTLRQTIVKTISDEYKSTGYFHEQYNDDTGKGQRCHPFTGWTALIVNILAESF